MSATDTLERPASTTGAPVTLDRDALLAAVRAVRGAVERRNTIPIIGNVLLRTENGTLSVIATDLDVWSRRTVQFAGGKIDITIGAERLVAAIETLPPGEVELSIVQGVAILKKGRSSRKLPTLPAADFPALRTLENEVSFAIDAVQMLRMLDTARTAVSTEEVRYYLCGVFMHIADGNLVAASVDGHRVVQVSIPAPTYTGNLPDSIMSTKAVKLICDMLGSLEDGAAIEFALSPKGFNCRSSGGSVGGKLIEATYPDYRRTIPTGHCNLLKVQSAEFERCAKAAASASEGRTNAVRLDLSADGCEASGVGNDGAQSVEPIDGEYDGESQAVGVNASYAMSIARMFGASAKLEIAFGGPRAVMIITCPDRPGVVAGIMPMNA